MIGTNGKKIGYSLMCCNCGNISNFALSTPGVEVFTCGVESKVDRIQINCTLPPEDLQFCKNLNCKYRPKCNKEENKQPSVVPNTTETIVTEKKYQ